MFLLNLGTQWTIPEVTVDGILFAACGVDSHAPIRRARPASAGLILFDPQLYMIALDIEEARLTCARLSTYPWVPIDAPEYDSDEQRLDEWLRDVGDAIRGVWPPTIPTTPAAISPLVSAALDFQEGLGVSLFLLPAPLTSDPDTDLSAELQWIDAGIQASRGRPILATVAVSDSLLISRSARENLLIQAIADQITAREELEGVYLVVEQARGESLHLTHPNVARSVLELCHLVAVEGSKKVILNYVDIFGLVSLGAGAFALASGGSVRTRRLHFGDYAARGGGGPFPRFYSHSTVSEYLPQRELERLWRMRLGRLFQGEETPHSQSLLNALRAGTPTVDIPDWREVRNNVRAARAHRIHRLAASARQLVALPLAERRDAILEWLQDAERNVTYINERTENDPLEDDARHVRVWRTAFEDYLNDYSS